MSMKGVLAAIAKESSPQFAGTVQLPVNGRSSSLQGGHDAIPAFINMFHSGNRPAIKLTSKLGPMTPSFANPRTQIAFPSEKNIETENYPKPLETIKSIMDSQDDIGLGKYRDCKVGKNQQQQKKSVTFLTREPGKSRQQRRELDQSKRRQASKLQINDVELNSLPSDPPFGADVSTIPWHQDRSSSVIVPFPS